MSIDKLKQIFDKFERLYESDLKDNDVVVLFNEYLKGIVDNSEDKKHTKSDKVKSDKCDSLLERIRKMPGVDTVSLVMSSKCNEIIVDYYGELLVVNISNYYNTER